MKDLPARTTSSLRDDLGRGSYRARGRRRRRAYELAARWARGVCAARSVRAKFVPGVRHGLSSLVAVGRTRRKRLELFGGQLAAEILFA
jgi:hypothetical protein